MKTKKITHTKIFLSLILTPILLLQGLIVPLLGQTQPSTSQSGEYGASFPRSYKLSGGGTVTLYEPQIASWDDQAEMVAWSALAYESKTGSEPVMGSIKIKAKTEVSIDERLVKFTEFEIPEVNFPNLSRDEARRISNGLQAEIPESDRTFDLDKILAGIDKSDLMTKVSNASGVKSDPPTVFYSAAPAYLIGFDGDPIWSPIENVDLKFAVNTNWDVFQETTTSTYYLRVEKNWFSSGMIDKGWSPVKKLPASFSKLPADDNWKEVKANIPAKKISADKAPKIIVATSPAELIVSSGQPKYEPITGTSLLWISNTETDLFRNGDSGNFYYLVAGRWFESPSLNGPWTFASPTLPADFQKIPVEHPRSRVLASVPGSRQAMEAVIQASVPRMARVNTKEVKAPDVVYQGDPNFEKIEGTQVLRAINTDKDVVKVGDNYYLCYQGVWFLAGTATGPWVAATVVPQQVYSIPASSPVHNVTYVTVKETSDPGWAVYSYYPGYTGMYIAYGCVFWGSGWYYSPYVYYGGYYPIYYPYYRTYGYAAWYNPYTGRYGRGAAFYGPYGGAGFGSVYNPYTGRYARGATVYGPYGSRTFAQAYNPRTGTYAQTRQGNNIYGSWGSTYVQRGDSWAQTGRVTNNVTGSTTGGIRTGSGSGVVSRTGDNGRTTIGRTSSGDIYAGRDGNVFRRSDDGWQRYGSGGWNPADVPKRSTGGINSSNVQKGNGLGMDRSTYEQLNRDRNARREGAQRTRDYNNYRTNMGGRSSAGSFRGGGMSRGGRRR